MIGRSLICIGGNDYSDIESFPSLRSAESDAEQVYDALLSPDSGDYDKARSRLLLSPTLDQLRQVFVNLTTTCDPIQTLTIFFAGHGMVHKGSLYLCLKNTTASAPSVSAMSLAEVLRFIGDQQIPQTNIILDACQSGGLLVDLNGLLNSDTMGARDTPGVTLLAMASLDESAFEDSMGGYGTQALLECLRGDKVVNRERRTLDLTDIGREVSDAFAMRSEQRPVWWGLNLTGTANFCINPHYQGDAVEGLPSFLSQRDHDRVSLSESDSRSLWKTYLDLPSAWEPRSFCDQLGGILTTLADSPEQQVGFTEGLARSLADQAERSSQQPASIEIYAVSALALLPFSADSKDVEAACERLLDLSVERADDLLNRLVTEADDDRFLLLSRNDGPYDFYFLPIRISKILGWASFCVLASVEPAIQERGRSTLRRLVEFTLEEYPLCLTAMNDSQAGAFALLGAALADCQFDEALCQIVSCYSHSIALERGKLAFNGIRPTRVFDFLKARAERSLDAYPELLARPSEFVAVCLRLASIAGMQDVVDDILIDLDHTSLNAYLPDRYTDIGAETLRGGTNVTMSIGRDVFRVAQFETHWLDDKVIPPRNRAQRLANMASSLIFPDRTAWSELHRGHDR